jgi:hypothetical protein
MNYKKIITLLILILSGHHLSSQQAIGGGGGIASPSGGALSTFADIPVSIATGIPQIGIPLLKVPSSVNGYDHSFGLAFNAVNGNVESSISEVGKGWSLVGVPSVYNKIRGYFDGCYETPGVYGYEKNDFDDVYYYNLPSVSGKFKFKRDVVNDTFTLINLSPNNVKIEYIRTSVTATMILDYLIFTDQNGYKYFLQDIDYSTTICPLDVMSVGKKYKSAFFVTKILNPLGTEIATFEYDKTYTSTIISTSPVINKLKSITTRKGKVFFEYIYDKNLLETYNDAFSLNRIIVRNPAGEDLYSYQFVYLYHDITDPNALNKKERILTGFSKNDKTNTAVENTGFVYNTDYTSLNKINYPKGGSVEYEFEGGQIFFDKNSPEYLDGLAEYGFNPEIQYKENILHVPVNTQNATNYTFTIPGDVTKRTTFDYSINLDEFTYPPTNPSDTIIIPPIEPVPLSTGFKNTPMNLTLKIKKDGTVLRQYVFTNGGIISGSFLNYPGVYTMEITTSVAGIETTGTIDFAGLKFYPGPYNTIWDKGGLRIKNINYYKDADDTSPYRSLHYDYGSFEQANSSSGYVYYTERDDVYGSDMGEYVLYKNVKTYEKGKGYTKYTFMLPDEYPKTLTGGTSGNPTYFWPYYNMTSGGLLKKKEVFNEQNFLLQSETNTYELENYMDEAYDMQLYENSGNFTKPSYIKKNTILSKSYFASGRFLETQSEKQIDNVSFQPVYDKIWADDVIKETLYTYPAAGTEYAQLVSAHMTGVPVAVEQRENGATLSKNIVKYNNTGSVLPTSFQNMNVQDNTLKNTITVDAYNEEGNVVQSTDELGISTVFIYGYQNSEIIAKITGAQYNNIKNNTALINAVNASNNDYISPATESSLIAALDTLRKDAAMKDFQMTTYSYNPGEGVTSETSAFGQRLVYEYNETGQVKKVKAMLTDAAGNITYKTVKEYQYNYIP